MDTEKILDRVRKLLALAESDNVNEAAAAAAQAQRLITKHQLQAAELSLDAEGGFDPTADIVEDSLHVENGTRAQHWKGTLAHGLAEANGCRVYWTQTLVRTVERPQQGANVWPGDDETAHSPGKAVRKALAIVGHPANVETVRYLFAYLLRQIDALCDAQPGRGRSWRNSFRHGAADTLYERVTEAAEREVLAQQRTSKGAALVRLQDSLKAREAMARAVDAYVQKHLDLRTTHHANRHNWDAYFEGVEAGSEISLHGKAALGTGQEQLPRRTRRGSR